MNTLFANATHKEKLWLAYLFERPYRTRATSYSMFMRFNVPTKAWQDKGYDKPRSWLGSRYLIRLFQRAGFLTDLALVQKPPTPTSLPNPSTLTQDDTELLLNTTRIQVNLVDFISVRVVFTAEEDTPAASLIERVLLQRVPKLKGF